MHVRAILVRSLFAVSRIYSRFVRTIARFSAQFQRKLSANHAKSAYFQRKSRKVSAKRSFSVRLRTNFTDNARPPMEKHSGRALHIFSQHIESI